MYASVALPFDQGQAHLHAAVNALLDGMSLEPRVLWSMQYYQADITVQALGSDSNTICLSSLSSDLALDDRELEDVKRAWLRITGESEETFLKFDAREGMEDED